MVLEGIPIPDSQCIGDSLQYLNNAFLSLSSKVVNISATSGDLNVLSNDQIALFYNSSSKILSAAISVPASTDETLTYDAVQQKWVDQRPFPTWNSTPQTSAQNLQLSSVSGNGFANWQRALTDVIRNNRDVSGDRLTTPSGTYPGTGAFAGGVLLSNGKVFCVPYNSTTARIYDPVTDTVTTPSGTYPGTFGAFQGGVLLPNGKVFCVPNAATSARIYDPVTDTLTTLSGTYSGITGGTLLLSGKVFCVPGNSTTARIYDPTDSYQPITLDINFVTSPFVNKY